MERSQTKKRAFDRVKSCLFIAGFMLAALAAVNAQPSGGPYGPVHQVFELPDVSGKIWYVAPDGNGELPGDHPDRPTTVEHAISGVRTGDAIILRGGTYRAGNLEFNQGITLQPYAGEQPVFKGTRVATEWLKIRGNLWKTPWKSFFRDYPDDWWRPDRFGMLTPLHIFNNDMVFVDGKMLHSAAWAGEVDENSFYIDYQAGYVYIGTDPENRLVEITAFNRGLHRVIKEVHGKKNDHKGLIVKGITLTQYAFCALDIEGFTPDGPADPSIFGKDVVGSVIEHCTFSYCGRVGVHLKGDNTVMRHCKVHDTTTEGVYLMSSSDCLLERNMFSRNNVEDIHGYYPAAVKIFNQTHRVTCRDNLVYELPLSNGIWYDVGNVDGRFINNWVTGVGTNRGKPGDQGIMWTNYNGFFFEISKGAICAGNVFEHCDQGIFILNSSNVEVYQNTFVNSTACISRDTRSAAGDHFGWHPATGPGVEERSGHVFMNNLLAGDAGFRRPLLVTGQHPDLCPTLTGSQLKLFDYNLFIRDGSSRYPVLVTWSPAPAEGCVCTISNLEELKSVFGGSSVHSLVFETTNLPLFRNAELGHYDLQPGFPGATTASVLPERIRRLLDLPEEYRPYPGAYPVR